MEISEINIISDFQAGIKCLQTPSLVSRFVSMESYANLQFSSFWKWGAIAFAIYATFSSLVKKIKLVLIYFHGVKPSLLHQKFEHILPFSEDDEDDISLASSSDEDDDDIDDGEIEVEERDDSSSRVKGSRLWLKSQWQNGHLWRQNSLACDITEGNVVRFWDSLGLSLDFDEDLINCDDSDVVVSSWGFDSDRDESSWHIPSVALTAEVDGKGETVVVRGYDSRIRRRKPALYGEWSSQTAAGGLPASVFSGERVYVNVRDEAGGLLAVGDVRNMKVPLDGITAVTDGVSA